MSTVAVDPLGAGRAAAPLAVAAAEPASDASAVEKLVNRIVHVESGGNARAKAKTSSATGLGQFLSQTWIHMMETYRPDLAGSLSRQKLLDLRYDPTLSREMVANLAREGEKYLRDRGHSITPGRLYLAHFLGMEGAHKALRAGGGELVAVAVRADVIRANGFLTGKDCNYLVAWAEKKMSGKAPRYASGNPSSTPGTETKTVVRASPEFLSFKAAVTKLAAAM